VESLCCCFPDALCRLGDGHSDGSIHASSMFDGDNGGEIEAWFCLNIVDPIPWDSDCPHPTDAAFPPGSSRRFQDYIPDIRSFGFQVWDIQNNRNSTGYLNIRNPSEQRILLSGRADFLITDSAETLSSYLNKTLVIIEIQSKPNEDNCDAHANDSVFVFNYEYEDIAFCACICDIYGW
jgi:hypothetical protein